MRMKLLLFVKRILHHVSSITNSPSWKIVHTGLSVGVRPIVDFTGRFPSKGFAFFKYTKGRDFTCWSTQKAREKLKKPFKNISNRPTEWLIQVNSISIPMYRYM